MSKWKPGYRWGTLAHRDHGTGQVAQEFDGTEGVCFDELVIDNWFHLEQMDTRCWWLGFGDPTGGPYLHLNIWIDGKGRVETITVGDESRDGSLWARWGRAGLIDLRGGLPVRNGEQ